MKMNKKSMSFSIPFYFPNWFMSQNLIKFFNFFYYWRQKLRNPERLVNWDSFFYPLDSIKDWNKIYGKKDFYSFSVLFLFLHHVRELSIY